MENTFTLKEQDQAMQSGMSQAADTQLPDERYAGKTSPLQSVYRNTIRKSRTDMDSKLTEEDIKEKHNISEEPMPKTKMQQKQADLESELGVEATTPFEGADVKQTDVEPTPFKTVDARAESVDLETAKLMDFDESDSYQMNFSTIQGGDDVSSYIAKMADRNKEQITEARRGIVHDEELRGLAEELGQDPKFLQEVLDRKEGGMFPAEKILAMRQVLEQSAVRLKELAVIINKNPLDISKADEYAFARQFNFHNDFQSQFMGARAEYGRGMRAMGIPTGGDGANDAEHVDSVMEMLNQFGRNNNIKDLANEITMMPSTTAITSMTRARGRGQFKLGFDMLYEVYINSILSGVKTHIINFTGSALRLGMDYIDTKVGYYMGSWNVPESDKIAHGEAMAAFYADTSQFMESWKVAWTAAKTGDPYMGIQRTDNANMRAWDSAEAVKTWGIDPNGLLATQLDFWGTTWRLPTERLMGGMDGFARKMSERHQIAKIAFRKADAIAKRDNLNPDEAGALLQDLMENPTEEMRREAADFGLSVTFQEPLGKWGKKGQNLIQNTPLRWVMPFVKTPANLMKQGFLERTPLGLAFPEYRAKLMDGGAVGQMARARQAVGTGIMSVAYMAAVNGNLTGSRPKDPVLARAMENAGHRFRSIRKSDGKGGYYYMSVDRMEPFAYLWVAMADLAAYKEQTKYMKLGEEDSERVERLEATLMMMFADNTLDRSFMTGTQDLMTYWTDPNKKPNYKENWVNSLIPYAGLRRDITRVLDNKTKRAPDGLEEYLSANLIWLADNVPPRRNSKGDVMKYDSILNPLPTSMHKFDKFDEEMIRIATSVRRTIAPHPNNKLGDVTLTNKEYDTLIVLSRKQITIDGNNWLETVKGYMESPEYEDSFDNAQADNIQRITKMFDDQAGAVLMGVDGVEGAGTLTEFQKEQALRLRDKIQWHSKKFLRAAESQAFEINKAAGYDKTTPGEQWEELKIEFKQGD